MTQIESGLLEPAGGSCDAACASTRQACDEDTMEAGLKTPTAAASALSSLYPCNGPYIMDCEEISVPFTTEFAKERRCWYGDGMCESNGPESHQGTTVHTGRHLCAANTTNNKRRFCPCKEPGGNGGQRALRDSPRTKVEGADSGQSIKVDYVKRKASKRLSLHSELASAWEKGAGSIIHGSNPEESWSPDREYWYNSLTGAVSYSSVSSRETHIDSTRNADLAASKAGIRSAADAHIRGSVSSLAVLVVAVASVSLLCKSQVRIPIRLSSCQSPCILDHENGL